MRTNFNKVKILPDAYKPIAPCLQETALGLVLFTLSEDNIVLISMDL